MDSSKLNDWLQIAASIGVILSLIFVGLEIQQSRQIAIADVFQQRAALAVQVQQGSYSVDVFSNAADKFLAGEQLNERELGLLQYSQNSWFQYWENNYFQYQIGLLPEATWRSSRNAIKVRLRMPMYREWWSLARDQWSADFAREVDQIILETKSDQ